jgi:serine/threonine protein kinase
MLCNKNGELVICYGLTKDPTDGKYMIVMRKMDTDLRKYLQKKQPTWKEKLIIANDIIKALDELLHYHELNRDLHSGNILYSEFNNHWYISDFGFCGPADKPLNVIYGNLPYIAPEVLAGRGYTSASDIYSFGMLMWEISSRQPPFINYEYDYYLMGEICKGERPNIRTEIPSKYKELMQQCWDADPLKRPNASAISDVIEKMRDDSYKNDDTNELNTLEQEKQDNSSQIPSSSSDLGSTASSTSSKIYETYKKPAGKKYKNSIIFK